MRRALLVALGVVSFAGFAFASMPARLVYDTALKPAGIEAGLVQGTVWDAQLWRITAGAQTIEMAQARLDPASLLGLSARFDATVADPDLRANGAAVLRPGGASLQAVSGVARLHRVAPELAAFAPQESLSFEIDELSFDGEGRCTAAQGRIASAVLITLGERYGVTMPALQGELFCAGEHVGVALTGASDAVSIDGRLSFTSRGLEGVIEARSRENDIIAALSFAGFDQVEQGVLALTVPLEN